MPVSRLCKTLILLAVSLMVAGGAATLSANQQILQTPLPGRNIPKYVEPLPTFVGARVPATAPLDVSMEEFQQKVLPAAFYNALVAPFNNGTYVWGYKVGGAPALYPGFTIEAQKGLPLTVTYTNNLQGPMGSPAVLQKYLTVDQTLHWADPLGLMCTMNPTNPECFTPYGYPTWPGTAVADPMPAGAPVPAVVHLHGGEVASYFDGGPDQWFTPTGLQGPGYASLYPPMAPNQAVYSYPNLQEATTLWFHDHALGTTRLNVYGGLAAFYLLRDQFDTGMPGTGLNLPAGPQEIEIAIQDRMFDTNGQWLFPDIGINPEHPFWIPEFVGDSIVVNGKTWPFLNVEPRRYRFRFLDGSNARFYSMFLENMVTMTPGPVFWQIGTDGGLLDTPVKLDPNDLVTPRRLLLGPGERADVIIDFSGFQGQTLTLRNIARTPFPKGATVDPRTTGQIMQFRVTAAPVADTSFDPAAPGATLRGGGGQPPAIVRLVNPATGTVAPDVTIDKTRLLTLNEVMGMGGPLEVLLNNTRWDGMASPNAGGITEMPRVGSTEIWEIVNLTADAHPIHVHLVQFQLLNRQNFNVNKYNAAYNAAFTGGVSPVDNMPYPPGVYIPAFGPPIPYASTQKLGGNPDVIPYLQGPVMPPEPNEAGWKDTVIMYPGQVTRIVLRWTPQHVPVGLFAGLNLYPFDPTVGPGYVWHCHILDHEDNEMMRPYTVAP